MEVSGILCSHFSEPPPGSQTSQQHHQEMVLKGPGRMCVRVFCWCNEYPREKNVLREEKFPLAHSSGGLQSMLGCLIMFRLLARQKHHCRRALGKASLFLVDRRKRRKGPQTKHALPRQSPPPIRLYFLDFLTLAMVPSNSKSISRLVQPWMESELSRSFVNAP